MYEEVPPLPPSVPFFIMPHRKKVDFDDEKWLRFIEKSVGTVPPQLSDQDIWLRSVRVRNHYFDVLTGFFTICRQKGSRLMSLTGWRRAISLLTITREAS